MEFMENIRNANHYAAFHHDHCMKGAKDPDTLDEVFGEGNWFKAPVPPCRHEVGTRDIVVKGSAKRREHVRTIKVYQNFQRCHCKWEQGVLAAKSPDLNLAENFFNEVQSRLRKMGISIGWPKNREELVSRIKKVANEIPKSWYKKAFLGLPARWEKVIERNGEMTDHWKPKND